MRSRFAVALAIVTLEACRDDHLTAPSQGSTAPITTRDAAPDVHDASSLAPASLPPAIDPGTFPRFGCATDAMPPHIAVGTATVGFRPTHGQGFHFRNVPARCGAAYPGQLLDGARLRPGEGAEFVVCMPDERRLDIGFLRRGTVAGGVQDVAHTEGLVRLRIGLDRYLDVVSPAGVTDPVAQLTFGPRLRTAVGSVRVARAGTHEVEGIVTFDIDCRATR